MQGETERKEEKYKERVRKKREKIFNEGSTFFLKSSLGLKKVIRNFCGIEDFLCI